jgi:hypothetical protein
MDRVDFQPGDVVFLEHSIAGVSYPTGYYVLCSLTEAAGSIALVGQDADGLYAIDNRYSISVEDLSAFSATGERARVTR